MCCFTHPVDVRDTHIFVRPLPEGRQAVVYAMTIQAAEEGAMVLPLPVAPESPENALRFHDLSKYPEFFTDLAKGFRDRGAPAKGSKEASNSATLPVERVGSYEASFVPTAADFTRLDERFRLPTDVLAKLPAWSDFGFAVFKLRAGNLEVHPMAFDFPTREPGTLFFPTVHVHDGEVHDEAEFDHVLYLQPGALSPRELVRWRESSLPAESLVKMDRVQELVAPQQHVYRKILRGMLPNEDQRVA